MGAREHVTMQVMVNGEARTVEDGVATVAALLATLRLDPRVVAVEVNRTLIRREAFARTPLRHGDELEIVRMVGGGARAGGAGASGGGPRLVIVESPAKAKTIGKFVGARFRVCPSLGHLVDLPRRKMGIDVEHDFEPEYVTIPERRKTMTELKRAAAEAEAIYLATDPDREGEAISWHLARCLGAQRKVYRVILHEITEAAVRHAFERPGALDFNKVNAQQARRVLDRLVGYNLSPLLWRHVGRGLSAGRVQSVALRLLVERERAIQAFTPEEYWELAAELTPQGRSEPFTALLEKIGDHKAELSTEADARRVVEALRGAAFVVQEVERKERLRKPSAPFTTSKLQQEAFNRLHVSVERTMRLAQELYEGLELGDAGSVGLITYMRTDSVRVSKEAHQEARAYIDQAFGARYLPPAPPVYKSRKASQEAHEAIRPTSVLRTPEAVAPYLTPDQLKLYDLIWRQFLASQMVPAQFEGTTIWVAAQHCLFKATGTRLVFDGFLRVLQEEREDVSLPQVAPQDPLTLVRLEPSQHFTKPPPRYTDASLVKTLEENGIGRPSTYAPTIATIVGRNYVERQRTQLVPTELGMVVTDLLVKHFPTILDIEFTAHLEEDLDQVEAGAAAWVGVVRQFYDPFMTRVAEAKHAMQGVKRQATPTTEVCERCGQPMVIKWGRNGRFLSCSAFPACRNARPMGSGVKCPQPGCDGELVRRRSKRGKVFYGCSRYPACTFTASRLPVQGEGGDGAEPEPAAEAGA